MDKLPPIIVTLNLDDETFRFFNNLRQQHFPKTLNFLDAHLTLFHHLPNDVDTLSKLQRIVSSYEPIRFAITEVISLGRGVAYRVQSEPLQQMHQKLQAQFQSDLTAQDRQKLRPHVTIQNKVTGDEARALLEKQRQSFVPMSGVSDGVTVWEYLHGPWRKVTTYRFR